MLLRDWDIERFFSSDRSRAKHDRPSPNDKNSNNFKQHEIQRNTSSNSISSSSIRNDNKILDTKTANSNAINQPKNTFLANLFENAKNHRRQESDSKLSMNFVRGFRREHTDFFPLSKRHSAVLGERQSIAVINKAPQRSSAIYSKKNKNQNDEPILTDFVSREYKGDNASIKSKRSDSNNGNQCTTRSSFFMGPRREKTESVILLRNSTNRKLLLDKQQVKSIT